MASVRNPEVMRLRVSSKRLPKAPVEAARRWLQGLLGLDRFNSVYRSLPECRDEDFARTFLKAIGATWKYLGEPDAEIPRTGPLIVVANHPFGLIDGFAVEALLTSYRNDFKLMLTHHLASIPELQERHIFVDPASEKRRRGLSLRGWRQATKWLRSGGSIGIFPAGRMARFSLERMAVEEQKWSPHTFALARSSQASVLPIYIHGTYGATFYLSGALYPPAIDLYGAGAVERWRGRTFEATIGRVMKPDELSGLPGDWEGIAHLKQEVERLSGN